MPESVNCVVPRAKRRRVLKLARGYCGVYKNVWTAAEDIWEKSLIYALHDRCDKRRNFRALWVQHINATARTEGLSYSRLMGALHTAGIEINRRALVDLAVNHSEAFKAIVVKVE